MEDNKQKIFVSYTGKDQDWAIWIAAELEKEGHKVIIQCWDFEPGDNFVLKMDEALRTSPIVVAVLSKAYLESYHCQYELTAAYAEKNQKLVPVRVGDFKVRGLWAPISYIDLVDKTEEEARRLLQLLYKKPERISKGYPGGKVSGGTMPTGGFPVTDRSVIRSSDLSTPDDRMPSHNLPNKNDRFTGRKAHLIAIHDAFRLKDEVLYNT